MGCIPATTRPGLGSDLRHVNSKICGIHSCIFLDDDPAAAQTLFAYSALFNLKSPLQPLSRHNEPYSHLPNELCNKHLQTNSMCRSTALSSKRKGKLYKRSQPAQFASQPTLARMTAWIAQMIVVTSAQNPSMLSIKLEMSSLAPVRGISINA
jgi:hypothetical protein